MKIINELCLKSIQSYFTLFTFIAITYNYDFEKRESGSQWKHAFSCLAIDKSFKAQFATQGKWQKKSKNCLLSPVTNSI